MGVHVLIAEAVYDHGVVGVFETRDDAVQAAEAIWPTTDGHHAFRVAECEIGRSYPDAFERRFGDMTPCTDKPIAIRFSDGT